MIVRASIILTFVAVLLLGGMGAAYLWAPEWITNQLHFTDAGQYYLFLSSTRSSLAALIGTLVTSLSALAAIATVYAAYRSYLSSQDKQASEVIAKATELLGSDQMPLRLGGIYALRRLARASPTDSLAAVAILTGCLRLRYRAARSENREEPSTDAPPLCPVDAQAILAIVGETFWKQPGIQPDISDIGLAQASMRGNWRGVIFRDARLENADFTASNLSRADFTGAHLTGCIFHLAILKDACLKGAVLRHPHGLSQSQIDSAVGDAATILPGDLHHPPKWSSPEL
jgi:pentapeptide repeat protein